MSWPMPVPCILIKARSHDSNVSRDGEVFCDPAFIPLIRAKVPCMSNDETPTPSGADLFLAQ